MGFNKTECRIPDNTSIDNLGQFKELIDKSIYLVSDLTSPLYIDNDEKKINYVLFNTSDSDTSKNDYLFKWKIYHKFGKVKSMIYDSGETQENSVYLTISKNGTKLKIRANNGAINSIDVNRYIDGHLAISLEIYLGTNSPSVLEMIQILSSSKQDYTDFLKSDDIRAIGGRINVSRKIYNDYYKYIIYYNDNTNKIPPELINALLMMQLNTSKDKKIDRAFSQIYKELNKNTPPDFLSLNKLFDSLLKLYNLSILLINKIPRYSFIYSSGSIDLYIDLFNQIRFSKGYISLLFEILNIIYDELENGENILQNFRNAKNKILGLPVFTDKRTTIESLKPKIESILEEYSSNLENSSDYRKKTLTLIMHPVNDFKCDALTITEIMPTPNTNITAAEEAIIKNNIETLLNGHLDKTTKMILKVLNGGELPWYGQLVLPLLNTTISQSKKKNLVQFEKELVDFIVNDKEKINKLFNSWKPPEKYGYMNWPKIAPDCSNPYVKFKEEFADKIAKKTSNNKILDCVSENNKYLIISDVHKESSYDVESSLDHFAKNKELLMKVLTTYKDHTYTDGTQSNPWNVIIAGDDDEFWYSLDDEDWYNDSDNDGSNVHNKISGIVAQNLDVYKLLYGITNNKIFKSVIKLRGNHDNIWSTPNNVAELNTILNQKGCYWNIVVNEYVIIPSSENSLYEYETLVLHGHQFDKNNCDENNIMGMLISHISCYCFDVHEFEYDEVLLGLDKVVPLHYIWTKKQWMNYYKEHLKYTDNFKSIYLSDPENNEKYKDELDTSEYEDLMVNQLRAYNCNLIAGHTHFSKILKDIMDESLFYANTGTCGWFEYCVWTLELTASDICLKAWTYKNQNPAKESEVSNLGIIEAISFKLSESQRFPLNFE